MRKLDTAQPRASLNAQSALVDIAMLRGRLREGERRFAQLNDAKARLNGVTVSPYLVAYVHSLVDGDLRGDVPRAIATLDSALRAAPPAAVPVARDQSLYLSLGYAVLGDTTKARSLLSQKEARMDSLQRKTDWVFMARVRGFIALAEGRTDSALAFFRRSDTEADGLPTYNCTVCAPLFIGETFDRGAQPDSARKYLTQYAEMPGTARNIVDAYFLAPTLFRLGELYENAGDSKRATEYYGRFVDLWKNADSDLQPRVAEARKRIDHLNRSKG